MNRDGRCHFCGDPVPLRGAAYRVIGWEVLRSQGGANRILGRERIPGMLAHAACAEKDAKRKAQGIVPGQGELL